MNTLFKVLCLFICVLFSSAYAAAPNYDDWLPDQPKPGDPDYVKPDLPSTKPKPKPLPKPPKLPGVGGIMTGIIGDVIIGGVDDALDWVLNPDNHKIHKEPKPGYVFRVNSWESTDSLTMIEACRKVLNISNFGIPHVVEKNGMYFCSYTVDDRLVIELNVYEVPEKTPEGPDATPPKPDTAPQPKPQPRPDTNPQPRPGEEPKPRPDTNPQPRPGEEPQPRPGEEPKPRPDTNPQPKPGEEPKPKPGEEPQPRPDTNPQPRPGEEPQPESDKKSDTAPQPFKLPEFCEWAKPVCDFFDWVKEKPPEPDPPKPLPKATMSDLGLEDTSQNKYVNFGGSCPKKDLSFTFNRHSFSKAIPMHHYCDFLQKIGGWLVAFTWLGSAIMIVRTI